MVKAVNSVKAKLCHKEGIAQRNNNATVTLYPADYRSMYEAQPATQTLEALERRMAELEADLSVINRVIRQLERALLNQPREDQ
jgi:hypothetical protein